MVIPELIRILVDEKAFTMDEAIEQFIDSIVITYHINIIQSGSHLLIAKVHVKRHIRFGQPGKRFTIFPPNF